MTQSRRITGARITRDPNTGWSVVRIDWKTDSDKRAHAEGWPNDPKMQKLLEQAQEQGAKITKVNCL